MRAHLQLQNCDVRRRNYLRKRASTNGTQAGVCKQKFTNCDPLRLWPKIICSDKYFSMPTGNNEPFEFKSYRLKLNFLVWFSLVPNGISAEFDWHRGAGEVNWSSITRQLARKGCMPHSVPLVHFLSLSLCAMITVITTRMSCSCFIMRRRHPFCWVSCTISWRSSNPLSHSPPSP